MENTNLNQRKLVILESPFAGNVEQNIAYARRCVKDSLDRGEAPIASHLLYTQQGITNDLVPEERAVGISAGLAWARVAEGSVVYTDRGISHGMKQGIAAAQQAGLPIEFREIGLPKRQGVCLVLAAPSGGGKSTILNALVAGDSNLKLAVSVTTRAPRVGEVDGVHYHFRTERQFDQMLANGEFIEHATVFGTSYGLVREYVQADLDAGFDVGFAIDWQGYRILKKQLQNVVGIYLLPPSKKVLKERLVRRGDNPDSIKKRMAEAQSEMDHASEFEHTVINDKLDLAIERVRDILEIAREWGI